MNIRIRKEVEPYSKTGFAYRAYTEDDRSLYMGEETRDALVSRVQSNFPNKTVTFTDVCTCGAPIFDDVGICDSCLINLPG